MNNEFKIGDKVRVTDTEKACDTGASVEKGDEGLVVEHSLGEIDGYADVKIEGVNASPCNSWSIPNETLELVSP